MPDLINGETAMIAYQTFEGKPTSSYVPEVHVADRHLHKEVEMAFVEKGKLTVRIMDEIDVAVHEGEVISISGSTLHKYTNEDPGTIIIKTKFMKDWLFLPFLDEQERANCQHLYDEVFVARAEQPVRELFAALAASEDHPYNDLFVFSKILELTAYLLKNPGTIRREEPVNIESALHMDKVLHFLQTNCSNPNLTLPMLAQHLGLSESYCSKFFSKNVKMTFVEYVNALRANAAQYMLINSDASITEIQQKAGFGSIQTFNRVFKKQTKMTPSEYRQRKGKGRQCK